MIHQEYSWTAFDGLPMFAQAWRPDAAPNAAIFLLHGVGDHSGRFRFLVDSLTAAGYAINAFDLRGHGRSGGPRVYTPSYDALLRDIDAHLENTRRRFPGIPHVLYGHSFGGAQALCYVMKRRPALAAVVASSPGLASGVKQSPVKVAVGRILSKIAPTLHVPLGSPTSTLSTDTAWVSKSLQDPQFYGTLSARIGIEQLTANEWILRQTSFPLPLLIQQGTADRYVDPDVTIAFARRLQGDVTLKVWEGLGHELHNELARAEVLAFVLPWLEEKISAA
jgi:alpha-beta hydrolase superfamily lysophospholipase